MIRKRPSNFGSHDDWLAHVRREIPAPEQPYALAFGRMELFRRFYRMHGLPFPTEFALENERIETMHAPERTIALETLNDAIFRSLTALLFNRARLTDVTSSGIRMVDSNSGRRWRTVTSLGLMVIVATRAPTGVSAAPRRSGIRTATGMSQRSFMGLTSLTA